jgi:threonine/homoserine/homoserine lactone efflux protein
MRGFEILESLAGIFFSSFIIAVSGALMPGPLLTVTISESARRGFWVGPMIIAGHAILEILLLATITFGLAEFITRPAVIGAIGILGGLILLWFSLLMLKSLKSLKVDMEASGSYTENPFLAGILMSLANPYWTIWWATIGLGYVIISMKFGIIGLALFFTGHILADLIWYSSISLMISRGKRFISDSIYRGVVAVCAMLLLVFGSYFGISGIARFL